LRMVSMGLTKCYLYIKTALLRNSPQSAQEITERG
jgi:hypothetical protein